jgi:hypothetical protein
MIAVRDEDVVLTRRTGDGRFVLFTSTDMKPEWTLPWWGVLADTGADAYGILVRADALAAPSGWTARQLLLVARTRLAAEGERCPLPATRDAVAALDQALACRWERGAPSGKDGTSLSFRPGGAASPYPWTVATQEGFDIPLCPDPESREEGVTPEQILIVLDQLTHDAARAIPYLPALWQCRGHVKAALSAQTRRLAALRG